MCGADGAFSRQKSLGRSMELSGEVYRRLTPGVRATMSHRVQYGRTASVCAQRFYPGASSGNRRLTRLLQSFAQLRQARSISSHEVSLSNTGP